MFRSLVFAISNVNSHEDNDGRYSLEKNGVGFSSEFGLCETFLHPGDQLGRLFPLTILYQQDPHGRQCCERIPMDYRQTGVPGRRNIFPFVL